MLAAQPHPAAMERPPSATPEPEAMDAGSPKPGISTPKSLPPGWKREVVVRKNGLSAGKSDVYYYSPCGKKFRSKPQIAKFLGENHSMDLSCFDFSRGAYGEVTQRRRARDRQISRKMETVKPIPVVKPLSVNPLRPSGPIRRTCGVIKLPVTWVAPPNDDQGRTNLTVSTPGDQKSQIHLIVQSLWEKRLFGVKPYDHMTGDEIAADSSNDVVEIKPITPIISKPHSPRTNSPAPVPPLSHSPTTGVSVGSTLPLKSPPCIIPSSIRPPQLMTSPAPLLPSLLQLHNQGVSEGKLREKTPENTTSISVIQQTGQPIVVTQPLPSTAQNYSPSPHLRLSSATSHHYSAAQFSNGLSLVSSTKPPIAPVAPMVTDRDLQLQEERVRLLRQQLLEAATQRPS